MICHADLLATTTALLLAATAPPLRAQQESPGDDRIREFVEDELLMDAAVPSQLILVTTDAGIVTLTGVAGDILAADRATAIARTVRGVRAVIDRIRVKPPEDQTPAELQAAVGKALLEDPATDTYEVQAAVGTGGEVTLTGRVQSWAERQLCEQVVKGVTGVTSIVDRIAVDFRKQRSDVELRDNIAQRLKWDILVDDGLLHVSCNDGIATLTGTVGSATERERARHDAWIAGVEKVDISGVKVERWARHDLMRGSKYAVRSDEQIRDAVRSALRHDPRVTGFAVDVTADSGDVTLRGTVDNLKARRAAADDARNTVGVVQIVNRLRVAPPVQRTRQQITDDVTAALAREPHVHDNDITVTVKNGIVSLYGMVDSSLARFCADDAAARVPGVIEVQNGLSMRDPVIAAFDPYVDPTPINEYPWYYYHPPVTFASDAQIERRIARQIWWSPFVSAGGLEVEVDAGVATLSGKVASPTARRAAIENAYDAGAVWVIDELEVQNGAPGSSGAASAADASGKAKGNR